MRVRGLIVVLGGGRDQIVGFRLSRGVIGGDAGDGGVNTGVRGRVGSGSGTSANVRLQFWGSGENDRRGSSAIMIFGVGRRRGLTIDVHLRIWGSGERGRLRK